MKNIRQLVVLLSFFMVSLFSLTVHAATVPYADRTTWQTAAGGIVTTIDFSKYDDGSPISNPPADVEFTSLTLQGITFLNVHSYYNYYLINYPSPVMHINLRPGTTAVGLDVASLYQVTGTFTVTLSTGETFSYSHESSNALAGQFIGYISTSPIQWIEIGHNANSNFFQVDNFSFVASQPFTFAGFYSPVDNIPVVNTVKAGSAVPVKFSLGGDKGLGILAPGFPTSASVPCSASASTDTIEQVVTASNSSLTYDANAGQYTYVWKTDKTWGGGCRQLTVKLTDGTEHKALFQFTR